MSSMYCDVLRCHHVGHVGHRFESLRWMRDPDPKSGFESGSEVAEALKH